MQLLNRVAFFHLKRLEMEIKRLEIFGKLIFESDAEAWLKLCKEQKREWILRHTPQRDEQAIDEFINNPKISKECKCLDCGKKKKDESSGVSEAVTTTTKPVNGSKPDRKNSVKRQASPKK